MKRLTKQDQADISLWMRRNALLILRQHGIRLEKNHPMIEGILRYLTTCPDGDESAWYFTVPSNDDYPHAPWWNYSTDENKVQSLGVSIALSLFVLEYGEQGDMGLSGLCALSEHLGRYQSEVKKLVDASIERDTSKWVVRH